MAWSINKRLPMHTNNKIKMEPGNRLTTFKNQLQCTTAESDQTF